MLVGYHPVCEFVAGESSPDNNTQPITTNSRTRCAFVTERPWLPVRKQITSMQCTTVYMLGFVQFAGSGCLERNLCTLADCAIN
jgi:hypothetical protein